MDYDHRGYYCWWQIICAAGAASNNGRKAKHEVEGIVYLSFTEKSL